jgi:subtilisin family serine protease
VVVSRHFGWCAAAAAVLVTLAPGALAQAPHDARQGEQWAVADGAVLNLPRAWQLSQGAGVVVAVIDSGARLEHPDLASNIWVNFDEVPGNRVDDDANGTSTTSTASTSPRAAAVARTSPTATATARTSPGSSPAPPTAVASWASRSAPG